MTRRSRPIVTLIGGAILLAMSSAAAWADKRVALVVGNSTYQTVPQLPNPSRDASAVTKMFKDAGFEVSTAVDVGNLDFKRAIRKFEADADKADIAVVYYAGHGIEIGGTNYLIPIDARLASDRDADDEAIPLERMVSSADGAQKLRIVILDACRDNPFTVKMRRERKVANRAVSSGLGKIEPTSTDTLIAYAAKAGSTAEDGDGQNSPFTAAVLKNLTVPGLDIRLAFGRVRDEVMKATNNKQEPFVYGSLGGGNIALVPKPEVAQETVADAAGVKADYDLVAKIGSRRAWEVFLGTYKTGFYADLARAQMASLNDQVPAPAAAATPGNVAVAAVAPNTIAPGREQASKEALEWDRVKDSNDIAALQRFIKRFPESPLSITAEQRLELLQRAAQERAEKVRIEREAAQKAAEAIRREAEQKKAEAAAAKKREEDERRAKIAEEQQKAKALEAERKAAEAKLKAEEAEKNRAAADAAKARAESEKQARQAEEERRKAELASAQEAACAQQQPRFDELSAKGGDGSGLADLEAFAKTVSCERLRPQVTAALGKFQAEAAKRAAAQPNSPELIRAAQTQLARLGCAPGKPDGALNETTKSALGRYFSVKNQPADDMTVTEALVSDLTGQSARVCPLECKAGQVAKGETCVADKPAAPPATARRSRDDDEDDRPAARKPQPKRQAERPAPRPAPRAEPQRARQQASRPSGGGGGGATMIGVGF